MGVLELHTWNAAGSDLKHPDRIIFDLGPDPSLPWSTRLEARPCFASCRTNLACSRFQERAAAKDFTSSCRWRDANHGKKQRIFASCGATHGAHRPGALLRCARAEQPRAQDIRRLSAQRARSQYLAPLSVRARPGLAMSMPVSWVELANVKRGDPWSMAAAIYHQRTCKGDPWEGDWNTRQRLCCPQNVCRLLGVHHSYVPVR
jgi:bifunctional non-homologous end joining protein LigD